MNENAVVYHRWNDPDSILFETPKSLIEQIRFSNWEKEQSKIVGWSFWEGQPKQNIKIGISSILQHSFQFGYERLISTKFAVETTLHQHHFVGFLDSGLRGVEGWGFDVGVKYYLFRKPVISENYKMKSLLSGTYIKTLIYYSSRKEIDFFEINDSEVTAGGIQIGREFSNDKGFNFDAFIGAHLFAGNNNITPIDGRFTIPGKLNLSESEYRGDGRFAYSFGIKLGYYF